MGLVRAYPPFPQKEAERMGHPSFVLIDETKNNRRSPSTALRAGFRLWSSFLRPTFAQDDSDFGVVAAADSRMVVTRARGRPTTLK